MDSCLENINGIYRLIGKGGVTPKKIKVGRYYNCGEASICIISVINEGIDWACYIGALPGFISESELVDYTRQRGVKLLEKDARYYFPDVKEPYRR